MSKFVPKKKNHVHVPKKKKNHVQILHKFLIFSGAVCIGFEVKLFRSKDKIYDVQINFG